MLIARCQTLNFPARRSWTGGCNDNDNDNDNDTAIKSLLKGKGLLPPVGLARLNSQGELLPMSFCIYFIPSISSYLLVLNKLISVPLMLVVNTFEIVKLSDSLVCPIRFISPVHNYICETTVLIDANSFN
jgi:hypothetical protein